MTPAAVRLFTLALLVVVRHAADLIQARKGEVSASGLYVPVSVDGYEAHNANAAFTDKRVTVATVPFDLLTTPGRDNFS
jgi:hypothetical protein